MRTNARLTAPITIISDYYPDPSSRLGLLLPITKSITTTTPATKSVTGATLRLYERRIAVRVNGVQPPHLARCVRGAVSLEFSGKARKRMISALNEWRIPKSHKAYFVTLTYPAEFPLDWLSWKADLEKFRRMLLDKFPSLQGFWRLELQQRGAPHYHLVMTIPKGHITNVRLYAWVRRSWARIAHKYDQHQGDYATRVDVMDEQQAIYKYISKYVSKPGAVPISDDGEILSDFEADNAGGMGRHWGRIGKVSREAYIELDTLSLRVIDELKRVIIGMLREKQAYYADYLALTPASMSWDCVGIPYREIVLKMGKLRLMRSLEPYERARVLSS